MGAGLLLFLASQHAAALSIPFINDDYVFLDKTRSASFLSLWGFADLSFHWYRPWSRELHYWTLQRWFGAHGLPFHLMSFALWFAILMSFWALGRRLAGARAAAVAVTGMASLAAWGVPLLWVASVQELWMLLFSQLTLLAWGAGRRVLATAFLALGLLSKESAAVLAPLLVAWSVLVDGQRPVTALKQAVPALVVTTLWVAVHPLLGGRWWHALPPLAVTGTVTPGLMVLWRGLTVALNADLLPHPEHGWGSALATGAIGAVMLGATLVASSGRGHVPAPERLPSASRPLMFAAVWALLGWMPLFMPSVGWHAYYALLGCFGVWLALGAALGRWPWAGVVLVVATAVVRPARADTPSLDWGSEWYQRRAAEFIRAMRAQLQEARPHLPPHSRLFFVRVPSNVGFLAGDGPALRVWYGDSTLRGGYYSSYQPRRASDPAGSDFFFRFDSTSGWVEVVSGPEDLARARLANPRWEKDHATLAVVLARASDWKRAGAEYEKLAAVQPARVDYAYDAGLCLESIGDSANAARWYARAAALPDADAEVRRSAERLAHHLRGPP
jgi:hypothetical protein